MEQSGQRTVTARRGRVSGRSDPAAGASELALGERPSWGLKGSCWSPGSQR